MSLIILVCLKVFFFIASGAVVYFVGFAFGFKTGAKMAAEGLLREDALRPEWIARVKASP